MHGRTQVHACTAAPPLRKPGRAPQGLSPPTLLTTPHLWIANLGGFPLPHRPPATGWTAQSSCFRRPPRPSRPTWPPGPPGPPSAPPGGRSAVSVSHSELGFRGVFRWASAASAGKREIHRVGQDSGPTQKLQTSTRDLLAKMLGRLVHFGPTPGFGAAAARGEARGARRRAPRGRRSHGR